MLTKFCLFTIFFSHYCASTAFNLSILAIFSVVKSGNISIENVTVANTTTQMVEKHNRLGKSSHCITRTVLSPSIILSQHTLITTFPLSTTTSWNILEIRGIGFKVFC